MTTPLRAKYIRDLAIRGRAERTQQSYSRYVSELARYYHRSPELISYEEVADWLYYLVEERELSASSVNIAVNAARFLYGITLGRNTDELMASVPRMKHTIRRAEIYARSEVEAILSAPRQPRDRAFLMTVYACGLRLAETNTVRRAEDDPRQTRTKTSCGHPHRETCYLLTRHGVGNVNAFIAGWYYSTSKTANDLAKIFLEPILAPEYQLAHGRVENIGSDDKIKPACRRGFKVTCTSSPECSTLVILRRKGFCIDPQSSFRSAWPSTSPVD